MKERKNLKEPTMMLDQTPENQLTLERLDLSVLLIVYLICQKHMIQISQKNLTTFIICVFPLY